MFSYVLELYRLFCTIVVEQLGKGVCKGIFSWILTIGVLILIWNIIGVLPGVWSLTSHFCVVLIISFTVLLIGWLRLFKQFGSNMLCDVFPVGTPLWLAWIMVPIELVSNLARGLSLGLRLGINVMAGHMLQSILVDLGAGFGSLGIGLSTVLLTLLCGLELCILVLQVYVLITLVGVYVKLDVH